MAGSAGVAFVVLVLLGTFIAGTPPDPDAGAGEIREFFVDNRSQLLLGGFLQTLAFPLIIWWVVVHHRMAREVAGDTPLPGVMVIGLVLAGAGAMVLGAVANGVVWVDGAAETMSDDVLAYAWRASSLGFGMGMGAIFVFLAASALVVKRMDAMPSWMPWLGGLAALMALVGTLGVLDAEMGMLAFLGFLALSLWILVVSGMMIAHGREGAVKATPAHV